MPLRKLELILLPHFLKKQAEIKNWLRFFTKKKKKKNSLFPDLVLLSEVNHSDHVPLERYNVGVCVCGWGVPHVDLTVALS